MKIVDILQELVLNGGVKIELLEVISKTSHTRLYDMKKGKSSPNVYVNTLVRIANACGYEVVVRKGDKEFVIDAEQRERRRHTKAKEQLCWSCSKACGSCSWSHNLTPVEGWKAKVRYIDDETMTYFIEECPLYERDANEEII